jgi:DNA polymerase
LCPANANVVPFHGPETARLVVVGEAPGATENAKGIPFCGDSGRELDQLYLPAAGMARQDVYVANAIRCLPDKSPPPLELVRHCSQNFLLPYIRERKSKAVFMALGKTAEGVLRQMLYPADAVLSQTPGAVRRFPKGWTIAAPHPAAAMRDESRTGQIMDQILLAFRQAGRLLHGLRTRRKAPDEIVHSGLASCWDDLVLGLSEPDAVSLDTETVGVSGPLLCLSFACRRERGLLHSLTIYANRIRDWEEAIGWLCKRKVIMHHALYDIEAVAVAAGWDLARRLLGVVEDTMLLAYEVRGLPLGLKALADLLAGMPMKSFESAMEGPFTRAMQRHMETVRKWLESRHEPEARVSGCLFEDACGIPERLLMRAGETLSDYQSRLRSLADEDLAPLAGRAVSSRQGKAGAKEAAILVREVNRRFSWLEALSVLGRAERLLDGTMEGLDDFLSKARECGLLQPLLPEKFYELITVASEKEVAKYANEDAVATLLVWEELRKLK